MRFFTKLYVFIGLMVSASLQLLSQTITITAPTSASTWCAGSSSNITWTSSGVSVVRIEGSPDGNTFIPIALNVDASAGTYTYSIPSNLPQGSQYRIRISDNNSSVSTVSDAFTIAVPTQITMQPSSQTVCAGQSGSLNVEVLGSNLTYQWSKNGVAISGATSSTYNFTGTLSVEGTYTVLVSGACGTPQTSSAATVTLSRTPQITSHPQAVTVNKGGSATFTVTAEFGSTYQWRKGGVDIIGNSPTLTLTNVQPSDAGNYDVRITNSCGSVTSNPALLTVNSGNIGAVLIVPATLDFGIIQPNTTTEKTLEVRNTGDIPLTVSEVNITGNNAQSFLILQGGAPFEVAPNSTHNITIRFFGNTNGNYTANVNFISNANFPSTVALTGKIGTATSGILSVTSTLDFGTVMIGTNTERTLTLSNTGNAALTVTGISFGGANSTNFSVTGSTFPFTIASGATQAVTIRFGGTQAGTYSSTALIVSNVGNATVNLSGIISATGNSKLTIASAVDFGQTIINTTKTLPVTITNTGTSAVMVNSVSFEGPNSPLFRLSSPFSATSIAAGQSMTFNVEFNPTNVVTASAIMRIAAADGVVTTNLTGLGVVSLSINTLEALINTISLTPNPAKDYTSLSMTLQRNTNAGIQVADMTGRIIRTIKPMSMLEQGNYTFTWNIMNDAGERSASGIYRLIIHGADGIMTLPLVVIE